MIRCRKIVGGTGTGKVLATKQPINFLSMVDQKTGKIKDPKHELFGKSLKGSVLVFPHTVGSSVGAYVFYSLKESGSAPSAIVCSKADITTASGCAIASIPLVNAEISAIKHGSQIRVEADSGTIVTV